jgi:Thioesterase-like superfamily
MGAHSSTRRTTGRCHGESVAYRHRRPPPGSKREADCAGVALTGQDRVLILADSANGLSLSLPMEQWFSIPPTMTATLLRPPTGAWAHLACRTYLTDDGIGLARADLSDPDGLVGEVAQPLLVQKRKPDDGVPDSVSA